MLKATARYIDGALDRLAVKSALYPLCWLCATMTPICFIAAYYFRDYDATIVKALLALGAAPLITTLLIALGFAIFDPTRLQSEDFQIRQRSLQLIQGRGQPEIIDVEAVVAIANPGPAEPPSDRREEPR
jgi:hypothetical protein